jgi:hypothetical protein
MADCQCNLFPASLGNVGFLANVGIGTASPTLGKLQTVGVVGGATSAVFSSDMAGISLLANNPAVGFNTYFYNTPTPGLFALQAGWGGVIQHDQSSGNMVFGLATSRSLGAGASQTIANRMFITYDGNVGVGPAPPTLAKLQTVGTVGGSTSAIFSETGSTGVAVMATFPTIGFNTYVSGGYKAVGPGCGGYISLNPNTGEMSFALASNAGGAGGAQFPQEMMRISSAGNVGIGTTTPTRGKLETFGTVGSTSAVFGSSTTGLSLMAVSPTIGFNTYVDGAGSKSVGAGFGGYITLDAAPGASGAMRFAVSSQSSPGPDQSLTPTEAMRITADQNVGIGTAAPQANLHVLNNTFSADALRLEFAHGVYGIRFVRANTMIGNITKNDGQPLTFDSPAAASTLAGFRFTSNVEVLGNIKATGAGAAIVADGNVNATVDLNAGHNLSVTNDATIGRNLSVTDTATITNDLVVRSTIRAGTGDPARKIADGDGCYYA